MDTWIVFTGLASFINFFIIHVIVLRLTSAEKVLSVLMNAIAIALTSHVAFIALSWTFTGVQIGLVWAALSLVIFFLLVFFYVLCVFGPTETSVRLRLIEELALAGQRGLDLKELLARYNAQEILLLRLKRLQESGDIQWVDGKYFLQKKRNVFFFIDMLAQRLKQWIKG